MKAEKSGFQDLSTASWVTFWSTPTHTRGGGPQSHTQLPEANASGSKDAIILTKDNWRPPPRATFVLQSGRVWGNPTTTLPSNAAWPRGSNYPHPPAPIKDLQPSEDLYTRTRKRRDGQVPRRKRTPPQPRCPAPSLPPRQPVGASRRPRVPSFRSARSRDEGGAGYQERLAFLPPRPQGNFLTVFRGFRPGGPL